MKRVIIIMIILMSPIVCAGTMPPIYPSDDAYVEKENPNTNYGTSPTSLTTLRVGYDPNFGTDRSYLKFDLSSLNGKTITSAKLSIFSMPSNGISKLYSVSNNNWNEESITWNNKPNESNFIESKSVTNSGRYEFNVLSYVQTSQNSFMLMEDGENDLIMFASKEYNPDNVNSPYLEVVYDGASICTTNADSDGDGKINMSELLNYISGWKSGSVSMSNLLNAIGFWKAGAGC